MLSAEGSSRNLEGARALPQTDMPIRVPHGMSKHEAPSLRRSHVYPEGLPECMAMSGVLSVINVVVAALSDVGYRAVTAVSKAARDLPTPTQVLPGPTLINNCQRA